MDLQDLQLESKKKNLFKFYLSENKIPTIFGILI